MIISNHQVENVIKLYRAANPTEVKKQRPAGKGFKPTGGPDKITLSEEFWEYRVAREAFAKVPEVRAEKVAQLKKELQEGTYQIDSDKVAEKILERYIVDTLV